MKGIIFSEFIEMVESHFSPEVADEIISSSNLPSGGMYTAVGTYHHGEMLELVTHLSEKMSTPSGELVRNFGLYLFGRFVELYPEFFEGVGGTFDFLTQIEDHVHAEVRKLYPDAQLPTFETKFSNADTLVMTYQSRRPFADLALGLIQGCVAHYGENFSIEHTDLSDDRRSHVRFTLRRH